MFTTMTANIAVPKDSQTVLIVIKTVLERLQIEDVSQMNKKSTHNCDEIKAESRKNVQLTNPKRLK